MTASRRTLLPRLVLAVVMSIALLGSGVGAAPASAADTKILMSMDGAKWSSKLPRGLFDNVGLLVPLDVATASLWVKNPTDRQTSMRVSVSKMSADSPIFATTVMLTAYDSVSENLEESELGNLATCHIVVPTLELDANESVRIDFTISVKDVPDRVAQNNHGNLAFKVAMRDGQAGGFPASACLDNGSIVPVANVPEGADDEPADDTATDEESGGLAFTGGDFPTGWLVLAGVLIGFGVLLLKRRRRDNAEVAAIQESTGT